MKLGCLRVTTILILSVAAIASADTAAGRVAAVIDGDDIELCTGSACTRIRLCGIDAPERGCPGYGEARAALRALVEGSRCGASK